MTKRQGRVWDLGAPYLSGGSDHGLDQGVVYNVPEAYKSEGRKLWRGRFENERSSMGDHLVEKLRGYMDDFGIERGGDSIPYAQIAQDGAVKAEVDNGWKVWGTTFVMAKLLDSFVYG